MKINMFMINFMSLLVLSCSPSFASREDLFEEAQRQIHNLKDEGMKNAASECFKDFKQQGYQDLGELVNTMSIFGVQLKLPTENINHNNYGITYKQSIKRKNNSEFIANPILTKPSNVPAKKNRVAPVAGDLFGLIEFTESLGTDSSEFNHKNTSFDRKIETKLQRTVEVPTRAGEKKSGRQRYKINFEREAAKPVTYAFANDDPLLLTKQKNQGFKLKITDSLKEDFQFSEELDDEILKAVEEALNKKLN